MRLLLLCAALTLAAFSPAHAQDTPPTDAKSIEPLWPAGEVPGALGTAPADTPKLYCYPAPGPGLHAAVIVLPGGGYTKLVMGKEGSAEAHWLNDHGVSAYVLQYRLSPTYMYPAPMEDGERAVRFVNAHAKAWHLRENSVGVWGFSAGGHLAGYLATDIPEATKGDAIDRENQKPDFAIISYGRLALDPAIDSKFGMKTLIGDNPTPALLAAINPIAHVTKDTSPTFLYATENDQSVNSQNATLFFNALQHAGVPAELHVFEVGPHGTGMGQNLPKFPELAVMPLLLEHWMQMHGWMP